MQRQFALLQKSIILELSVNGICLLCFMHAIGMVQFYYEGCKQGHSGQGECVCV